MFETLNIRCAQRVHAATFAKQAKSLGVVAVETAANAGELAREIAVITAGFGKRVILINARETSEFGVRAGTAEEIFDQTVKTNEGYLEVRIASGSEAHRIMNDGRALAQLLEKLCARVDAIVFDLPAHDEDMSGIYTPNVASVLDAVLLVALPQMTTKFKLIETITWLTGSGGVVLAIVVNDRYNPTLGDEIIREARRLAALFPGFPKFIARNVEKFPALNRHH
jgi:Mrp family chromosome partitioning ATPase